MERRNQRDFAPNLERESPFSHALWASAFSAQPPPSRAPQLVLDRPPGPCRPTWETESNKFAVPNATVLPPSALVTLL